MYEFIFVFLFPRFGSSSIELGHELLKLGDVCLGGLQSEGEGGSSAKNRERWISEILDTYKRASYLVGLHYGAWHPLCKEIQQKSAELAKIPGRGDTSIK